MDDETDIRISAPAYNAQSPCRHAWVEMPDKRSISFFVNRETGLIVVDVVAKDGRRGVEVLRMKV